MIRLAIPSDIHTILNLTKACAKVLIAKGIYQWNEFYPSKSRLAKDIAQKELYVYQEEDSMKGIMVLSELMDDEYIDVEWLTPNQHNLYIHRLAVDPEYWGQGYARKLMDFAESYAKTNAYQSVRLDTFSQNHRNQKFYETRGYQRLGNIFFPKQSEHPFYCYELVWQTT